ncbi:MAG: branched-chain-amino-acid transaminase [Symbiobacteriia bacterium]
MGAIVYLDGEFLPGEEARVSVFDHGFLYGDGVFEGIRAYAGRVFRLPEHVRRLYESAHAIRLEPPLTPAAMEQVILATVRRTGLQDAYIRPVISRGPGDMGIDPSRCPHPTVMVAADSMRLFPDALYQEGLRLVTVPTRRNLNEATSPRIKSLNYLNNILARLEGNHLGYPEVLMLSAEGYVAEGTGENIFILRRGELLTPPASAGVLEGITRSTVMELARAEGVPVREALFTRYDLYTAAECILTGTAAEVIPVVECDGRRIGDGHPGPLSRSLIAAYRELVRQDGTPVYE